MGTVLYCIGAGLDVGGGLVMAMRCGWIAGMSGAATVSRLKRIAE